MEDSQKNPDLKQYLEDIREIKGLLSANQEKPIIEAWAYFVWSACIGIATIVHLLLVLNPGSRPPLLWLVWIPAMLVGGTLESIGFIQVYRRRGPVLVQPKVLSTYLILVGISIGLSALLVFFMLHDMLTPGLLVCSLAICFMVVAQASYHRLLIPAYMLLALGIPLLFTGSTGVLAVALAGFGSATAFFLGGLHTKSGTNKQ